MAGHAAVAAFAAVGVLTLMPEPVTIELSWIAYPALTILFGAGLLLAGRQAVLRARREAQRSATTDPESGLATQATAERVLALEFAAAQRGRPLTVVLFRLEKLPLYAKRHGAVVARQLLRLTARALRRHQRGMHLAALGPRDGVYLSILSGMEPDGACIYAQRVRREILSLRALPSVPPVSVGVVPFDMSMTSPAELLEQAERALAKGADAGGKVVVVGQLAPETST